MPSNTLAIAQQATAFSGSPFGKHYIERLKMLRKSLIEKSMDIDYPAQQRADYATQASTYHAEIEYFDIARNIVSNPTVIAQLKDKLKKKGFEDIL